MLIDVVIPTDRNVVQNEAEKKLKYNSLCAEIQRMWTMQCVSVPVICGATGTVTKGLKIRLEAKAEKHTVDPVQRTAVFGTSHIIRKVLSCRLKLED